MNLAKTLWAVFAGILSLFFIVFIFSEPIGSGQQCDTVECFSEIANKCDNVSVQWKEEFGAIEYSAKECVFVKKIIETNEEETEDMKRLFTGRSLTCEYEAGEFNEQWLTSFVYGLDNCEGELKELIGQMLIFV